VFRKELGGSSPPLVALFSNECNKEFNKDGIDTKGFERFLRVQKNLADQTVKSHICVTNIFLKNDSKGVQEFMLWVRNNKSRKTYGNYLCTMKVLFRDYLKHPEMVNDFKFPSVSVKPKTLPSKDQLKTFFHALPDAKYNIIFLALVSSGLRISELLSADIDRQSRMIVPKSHDGKNKKGWISFYNDETEEALKKYQGNPFENSRSTVNPCIQENRTGDWN
jgi:integrase